MKKQKLIISALALTCALAIAGLAGCGGNSASNTTSSGTASGSASASASASASSGPSIAEEKAAIEADIEKVIGTTVSKETLEAGLRANSDIQNYIKYGFDVSAYAENMANIMKLEILDIDVDGDEAVAHVRLIMPNFNDASVEQLMTNALQDLAAGKDVQAMPQDEQLALIMNATTVVLTNPDFPTATSDFDIDYVKKNGEWTMADPEGAQSLMEQFAGTLT